MKKRKRERQRVPTQTPWAATVGYSRAVRVGRRIWVAGTAAVGEDGNVAFPGDPYLQTKHCLGIISAALESLGAAPADVVRTRVFIRDAAHWQAVGRAHGEVFAEAMPASTMVVVTGFVDSAMLVEIEAEAVV